MYLVYEVRRCVLECCTGRETVVVMARSPVVIVVVAVVHQPRAHTP